MEFVNTYQVLNAVKSVLSSLQVEGSNVFKRVDILIKENGTDAVLNWLDGSIYPRCLILKDDEEPRKYTTRLSYERDLPIRVLICDKLINKKQYEDTIFSSTYELEPLVIQEVVNINNDYSWSGQTDFNSDTKNNIFIMELNFNYNSIVNFER